MTSSLLINSRIALWAFDFDGNILRTPTKLYLINNKTWKEEIFEWHILDQHPDMISWSNPPYRIHEKSYNSFAHFRDFSEHENHNGADQLLDDIKYSLKNQNFSPSFQSFKDTFLVHARLFAIITARGHSGENMARAMTQINNTTLTDEEKDTQYINICAVYKLFEWKEANFSTYDEAVWYYFHVISHYYPVSSTITSNWLEVSRNMPNSQKKTIAMKHFIRTTKEQIQDIKELRNISYAIGFSDDSISNIEQMLWYFSKERASWNTIKNEDKVRIYYTWIVWKFCPTKEHISEQRWDTLVIKL
jgi:hypothetical protein